MEIAELSERARLVFRQLVDAYLASGEPVGSRTLAENLAERMGSSLSPATIRHVLAELEGQGLLAAPHISAGRVPTARGLRLYVDGLLEFGDLSASERASIESAGTAHGQPLAQLLTAATRRLSDLTACTGLVLAPKQEMALRQIDFVPLAPTRVLVILVGLNGEVENRILEMVQPVSISQLQQAANFLNSQLAGKTLSQIQAEMQQAMRAHQASLDALSAKVVEAGLALWPTQQGGQLIIRGHAQLLKDVQAVAELENIRQLFDALELEKDLLQLLSATQNADGVKVFIGAEHPQFAAAGCSLIMAPFGDGSGEAGDGPKMVGAIGVIGPLRLNYARLVPLVDYTAQVLGKMLAAKAL